MVLFRKLFGSTEKPVNAASNGKSARGDNPVPGSAADVAAGMFDGVLAIARSLNAAGRHAEALTLVDDGLESVPESPELLFARASILFDWGRYREARNAFVRAAAAGMSGAALEVALGWAHLHSGDAASAVNSMRRAEELDPEGRVTRMGLATVLFRSGRFAEAEAAFDRLLDSSPAMRLPMVARKLQTLPWRRGGWRTAAVLGRCVRTGACDCVEGPRRSAQRAGSPAGSDQRVGDGPAHLTRRVERGATASSIWPLNWLTRVGLPRHLRCSRKCFRSVLMSTGTLPMLRHC